MASPLLAPCPPAPGVRPGAVPAPAAPALPAPTAAPAVPVPAAAPVPAATAAGPSAAAPTLPRAAPREETAAAAGLDAAWHTVVWDDPVNLMTYVTWVFQKLFGYSREHAEKLMLDVHHEGRAVVSRGARERMEYDASRLHAYGLWATVDRQ